MSGKQLSKAEGGCRKPSVFVHTDGTKFSTVFEQFVEHDRRSKETSKCLQITEQGTVT